MSIVASLSCVVIKAQLTSSDEIGPIMEFANSFEIQIKHLVIEVALMPNSTVLQNKNINYNAMIYHDGRMTHIVIRRHETVLDKLYFRWKIDITLSFIGEEVCIDTTRQLPRPSSKPS